MNMLKGQFYLKKNMLEFVNIILILVSGIKEPTKTKRID